MRADLIELDGESVELLESRTALGALVNIVNITAVNLAIAVNAATWHSTANAAALQGVAVHRH